MGAIKFFSSNSRDCNSKTVYQEPTRPSLPNPDPGNFNVLRKNQKGPYLIVEVQYPDCTNYEGRKIMVYETTYEKLMAQGSIDPHFSKDANYISPIARFEPTLKGWSLALSFVKLLNTK